MNIMILINVLIMIISMLMIIISSILSMKTYYDREKMSPFECGFDPKTSARIPFSLHFFLIAVIFLIFDVEITLILPFIFSIKIINIYNYMMMFTIFIMILLAGLYHEWNQGALQWAL